MSGGPTATDEAGGVQMTSNEPHKVIAEAQVGSKRPRRLVGGLLDRLAHRIKARTAEAMRQSPGNVAVEVPPLMGGVATEAPPGDEAAEGAAPPPPQLSPSQGHEAPASL